MRALATLLVALLIAGCINDAAPEDGSAPTPTNELRAGDAILHTGGVRGGLSVLHLSEGPEASIAFPSGVLVLGDDGFLRPATEPVSLARGSLVQYLPPYGASEIAVEVDGETFALPLADGKPFVSGERVIELMKVQEAQFPHRTPGQPAFNEAVAYFAEYFAALGMEVEEFRTPLPDVALPGPLEGFGTQSVVSVVATKRGTDMADRYIVLGGHFDVVPGTTHGALDNTGGTMSVLALAETFSRINTSHSMIFAAWGGEENGLLGSQAWLSAHPELVPFIDLYLNYDVTGLAWPAPAPDPAPIVAATGPDGPLGDAMAAAHASVVADWMQVDAPFVYEPVAQGQATGAGVNAQSDHTPFLSRGIPVLFQFTSRVDEALSFIHTETDTLANLTGYALRGPEGVGAELNATEIAQGEALLADSFEVQMSAGFYLALLMDQGVLATPRPASFPLG